MSQQDDLDCVEKKVPSELVPCYLAALSHCIQSGTISASAGTNQQDRLAH